uniref:Uncharacterized protein n=1 Tax=Anguilla anguilla TaxID=7936 RepID=A0A0E9X7S4_ANGAN
MNSALVRTSIASCTNDNFYDILKRNTQSQL